MILLKSLSSPIFVYVYVTVSNGFVTNNDTGYFLYLFVAEKVLPNSDPIFLGGLRSVYTFEANETSMDVIRYYLPSVFD